MARRALSDQEREERRVARRVARLKIMRDIWQRFHTLYWFDLDDRPDPGAAAPMEPDSPTTGDEPAMTWEEIGEELGISRDRAHEIGAKAIRKLAHLLRVHRASLDDPFVSADWSRVWRVEAADANAQAEGIQRLLDYWGSEAEYREALEKQRMELATP